MLIKSLSLDIKKNAHTTIPVTIPAHELAIVELAFGEGNIYNKKDADPVELDTEGEYDRLCRKYSSDAVMRTFGESPAVLSTYLEKFEVKAKDDLKDDKAKK